MSKEYTVLDLKKIISDTYTNDYTSQAGALRATLSGVLNHVKKRDPEMFKDIMEFEMKVSERIKAEMLDKPDESDYT